MRICILANVQAVHTQRWAAAYARRGHQVHVLSIRGGEVAGAEVHSVHLGPRNSTSVAWTAASYCRLLLAARGILRRLAPDVLHAHYTVTHGAIAAWARFHPRVVSAWGRDVVWDGRSRMPWPLRALNRFALAGADRVCATSRFLAAEVERFTPAAKRVHVVPFGIDPQQFAPPPAPPPTGPPRATLRIGFVKTLRRKYGPEVLLRAFARVVRQVPQARLVMAGRGPLAGRLRHLAGELGVAGQVEMPGFVPHAEVPELMRSFDVFVNPSVYDSETFGVAILEASCCALPVVATRVGGVPEVCRDGDTGLLVERDDPVALAEALLRLAGDPALRRRLGTNGRRFVLDHYVWSDNVEQMIGLLEGVVRGSRDE